MVCRIKLLDQKGQDYCIYLVSTVDGNLWDLLATTPHPELFQMTSAVVSVCKGDCVMALFFICFDFLITPSSPLGLPLALSIGITPSETWGII